MATLSQRILDLAAAIGADVKNRLGQQTTVYLLGDNAELVASLPIAVSSPTKFVIMSVAIPEVQVGDTIIALADLQATNDQTYNALFSTQLIAADSATNTLGSEISEAAGTNITPGNHHMQVHRSGGLVVANSSRRFINLVGWSAASNALAGDVLGIDADYGRMTVQKIRGTGSANGPAALPDVDFNTDVNDILNA